MHLGNFSLITDMSAHGWSIALTAYGVEWDLHNYATFEGFDYETTIEHSTLTLKWHITKQASEWVKTHGVPNAAGVPNYSGHRFCLVFSNVDYLEIAPRDPEMPRGEDLGLNSVSCIEASEDSREYIDLGAIPNHDPINEMLPYHMVFRFNGGQFIRVGAKKAEFILLD